MTIKQKKHIRIIARLDIKGSNLVKGIHLEGLRVLGRPSEFSEFYYKNGIDEIFYQDVVASLYNRNGIFELVKRTAEKIFIPLSVGGGLRTLDDISNALDNGADKVSINTAAIKSPKFITNAANKYGSSTIIVNIEAKRNKDGKYSAFTDNGREKTDLEVVNWAKECEALGAGEIVITSVDNEGTGNGFDIKLIRSIVDNVNIPVTAHGGAGNANQITDLVDKTNVNGICISSIFHYNFIKESRIKHVENEGNITFLKSKKNNYKNFETINVRNLKELIRGKVL